MGGTLGANGACTDPDPTLDEPELYPYSETFERLIHNVQNCQFQGQDRGWLSPGQIVNSYQCWSGGPVYQDGIEVFNLREMLFSGQTYNTITQSCGGNWNERVLALRTRKLETGCPAGYTLRRSRFSGQLECYSLDKCPVGALEKIPDNDLCANTLDRYNATQAEIDAACGTLTSDMRNAVGCFRGKLAGVNNPATGQPIPLAITAGIRNVEYQRHLREVWDKMEDIVDQTIRNPALQTACATRRAELAAEKGCNNAGPCESCPQPTASARNHCLVSRPARPNPNDATHTQGTAIDVDRKRTVNPLENALGQRNPPQTIQGFLDAPTNCRLHWLGDADRVHFELQ